MSSKAKKGIIITVSVILILAIAFIGVYFGFLYGENVEALVDSRTPPPKPELTPDASVAFTAAQISQYDAASAVYATAIAEAADANAEITVPEGEKLEDQPGYQHPYSFLSDAEKTQVKLAFISIFQKAGQIRESEDFYMTVSLGGGDADVQWGGAKLGGGMSANSFFITKKTDGVKRYYYQNAALVTDGASSLLKAARGILNQLNREYTPDYQTFYKQNDKGEKVVLDVSIGADVDLFPYMTALGFDKINNKNKLSFTKEQWEKRSYCLDHFGELTNFDFTEANIDGITNVGIEKITAEDGTYYKLCYSLNIAEDIKNVTGLESLDQINKDTDQYRAYVKTVEQARKGLRESANSENLEYDTYDANMEIWDNGYIRSSSSVESWKANMDMLGGVYGKTASNNVCLYYWTWEDACKYVLEADANGEKSYDPYNLGYDTPDDFIDMCIEDGWFNDCNPVSASEMEKYK